MCRETDGSRNGWSDRKRARGNPRGPSPRDPEGLTSRTATAPPHLLMTELILDSKNTILPGDPAISPAGLSIMPQFGCSVGNVHSRLDKERPSSYVYVLGR